MSSAPFVLFSISRCLAHSLYLSPGIADPIADVERRKEEKERHMHVCVYPSLSVLPPPFL